VKDYSKELSNNLNSFGFLLDSPILNIDTALASGVQAEQTDNKKFGKINIIENYSLPEIIFNLIKNINQEPVKKELAECLLCAIVLHTTNFKNGLTAEIFQTVSELMKNGADLKKIINNLKL
jgi:hypothetical protein